MKNDWVSPPLLENPQFQSMDVPGNITVPVQMYDAVKKAYAEKIAAVRDSSYDISKMRAQLEVMPGSDPKMVFQEGKPVFVTFQLKTHIPLAAELDSGSGPVMHDANYSDSDGEEI